MTVVLANGIVLEADFKARREAFSVSGTSAQPNPLPPPTGQRRAGK